MSNNDAIVLKSNFDDWRKGAGDLGGVSPWLYYCVEQFLKSLAPEKDEIVDGVIDGGGDGGVDAAYFIVNQRQFVDEDTTLDPKSVSKIRLMFFQMKESGGFAPTEIEKWIQFSQDFFDLSKSPKSFGTRYSKAMKVIMETWRGNFLKIAGSFPEVAIEFFYVAPGGVSPDQYVLDATERVKLKVSEHTKGERNNCDVHLIGASELWAQVQKRPPKSKTLKWVETPMSTAEGYVGLVKLADYYEFLQDEPGVLAERIFESNVRGYQSDTSINSEILETLRESSGQNFWLLNNGITIVSPNAAQAGHKQLSIEDPQIVNGLQTSRVIFRFFDADHPADDERSVLVRVISTSDLALQDRIIRATNSQNKMATASLRMTDQIHRDIEEYFKQADLYYDRRKGHYRDQGHPIGKIVGVNFLVQSVISILLQRPDDARARPGDYFKKEDKYSTVFKNPKFQVDAYLKCVQLMARVDSFFVTKKIDKADAKNLRFYVAAFLARGISKLEVPVPSKLTNISKITDVEISAIYNNVYRAYSALSKEVDRDAVARGPNLLKRLSAAWKRRNRSAKKSATK